MTATVMPPEMVEALKPDYVAPLVCYLGHEANRTSAGIFEVGSGWIAKVRWQRSGGVGFPVSRPLTPEAIAQQWNAITNFDDGRATYPTSTQESFQAVFENIMRQDVAPSGGAGASGGDPKVAEAQKLSFPSLKYTVTDKEVILYNLGIGATRNELPFVYESDEKFMAIPTFGVIPPFEGILNFPIGDIIGSFNPVLAL